MKKGIRENPEAWRLWYHLGYIYFDEMHDSKAASEAFLEGSKVPGALPWMKVMAAALAQHAGEAETARYLWTQIYNSSDNPDIRANAVKRLIALRVDEEVERLQEVAGRYRARNFNRAGKLPPTGAGRGICRACRSIPWVIPIVLWTAGCRLPGPTLCPLLPGACRRARNLPSPSRPGGI